MDVWQAELAAGQQALEQKIAILALMTLIFNRAGDERVLEFGDIVQASTTTKTKTAAALLGGSVRGLEPRARGLGVVESCQHSCG